MGQESEEAALLIRAGKLMKNALLIPVDQLIHTGFIERIGTGEAARDLLKGEMRIPSKQLDDAGALFLTVLRSQLLQSEVSGGVSAPQRWQGW